MSFHCVCGNELSGRDLAERQCSTCKERAGAKKPDGTTIVPVVAVVPDEMPTTVEGYKARGWTLHPGSDGPTVMLSPDGDSQVTVGEHGEIYDDM